MTVDHASRKRAAEASHIGRICPRIVCVLVATESLGFRHSGVGSARVSHRRIHLAVGKRMVLDRVISITLAVQW